MLFQVYYESRLILTTANKKEANDLRDWLENTRNGRVILEKVKL